jgi:hypothetical protein
MDGELPGVEHRQIHEHLGRCRECAEEYSGLLRMKRLLAGLRVREPRTDLATRIVEQVHHTREPQRNGAGLRWTQQVGIWWKSAGPSSSALAFGAGLAIMGVVAVSHFVDGRETIQWSPVNSSAIASHQLAPDDSLDPQNLIPTPGMRASISSVGYSSGPLIRDAISQPDPNPQRESVVFLAPPPQISLMGPR